MSHDGGTGLTVEYSASAGRPYIDMHLSIRASGEGELRTSSSASVPAVHPDRAGTFRGPLPPALLNELATFIDRRDALSRLKSTPMLTPETTIRGLKLSLSGRTAQVSLGTQTPPLAEELEKLLFRAMKELLAHPEQAVQVAVSAEATPGGLRPTVRLRSLGHRPFPIRLRSAEVTVEERQVLPSGSELWTPVVVNRSFLVGAATKEALELAQKTAALAPGEELAVPLAELSPPSGSRQLRLTARATLAESDATGARFYDLSPAPLLWAPGPAAGASAESLWDLAGAWSVEPSSALAALELTVVDGATVRASELVGKSERGQNLLEASLEPSGRLKVSPYQGMHPRGPFTLVVDPGIGNSRTARLERDGKSEAVSLARVETARTPGQAVKAALELWARKNLPPPEPSELGVSLVRSSGPAEYWVSVPQGRDVRPARLTIAVEVKTGAVRGPFGR